MQGNLIASCIKCKFRIVKITLVLRIGTLGISESVPLASVIWRERSFFDSSLHFKNLPYCTSQGSQGSSFSFPLGYFGVCGVQSWHEGSNIQHKAAAASH